MDCRTVQAVNFRKELGFNQQDPMMIQEQSVLTKLDTYFKTEEKIFQHYVLRYRIDMYIPEYKLAIEDDELGHCTRDLQNEIERKKRIEEELGCKFIRIDPSRESFDIVDEFSRIKDYLLKSTNKATKKKNKKRKKKETIDQISDRLLNLEFKSTNSIKTKLLRWVVKKLLPKI